MNSNLITKLKNKDEHALEIVYTKYYKLVCSVIYGIVKSEEVTEELLIDTFHKAYNKIDTFIKDDVISFKYWLIKIAKNLSYDYLRSKKNNIIYDNDLVMNTKSNDSNNSCLLYIFYSNLDQDEIDVINYHLICNMKFREIASLMNTSINVVSKKYYNALKKIRSYLGSEGK